MKQIIFVSLCILFSFSNLFSQWSSVITNSSSYLRDVKFVSQDIGIAVGSSGTILRTTNSGDAWSVISSNTIENLISVDFIENNGWIVGAAGTILYSSNSGETWNPQNSGTNLQLISVDFLNSEVGYALGGNFTEMDAGIIIKTTNGGISWHTQKLVGYVLTSINFAAENYGWAVGISGMTLYTTDGGTTWNEMWSGSPQWLYSVFFIDRSVGYAVGGNVSSEIILKTTNGGLSWNILLESNTYQWLASVYFLTEMLGWAAGENGVILKTTNGGITWITEQTNTSSYLRGMDFLSEQVGWCAGENGTIIKRNSETVTALWQVCQSNSTDYLRDIYLIDTQNYIAVGGNGTILKSTNLGQIWNPVSSGTSQNLVACDFVEGKGWAVGAFGTILYTSDFGDNWTQQISGTSINLLSVDFVNQNLGYIVGGSFDMGEQGIILKTTNGGNSWTVLLLPYKVYTAVKFASDLIGYVVGTSGSMLKTTDGGVTWFGMNTGTPQWLYGLDFINADQGWIVGGNVHSEIILYTSDGGNTWQKQREQFAYRWLGDVKFLNAYDGWAVGDMGVILRTKNGGHTWAREISNSTSYLRGLHYLSDTLAFAAGSGGSIMKYSGIPDSNYVLVGYPNGGEVFTSGSYELIEWTGFSPGTVKLEYSSNGGEVWNLIADNVANNWNYNWFVPSIISNYCLIRISSKENPSIQDVSDYYFRVDPYVPVELNSFNFSTSENSVVLNWSTSTEVNNNGFVIQRKTAENNWITRGFIKGKGTTAEIQHYNFVDSDLTPGNYIYRITQIDYNGTYEVLAEQEIEVSAVYDFSLKQNYPNPFNPSTIINYSISEPAFVSLKVYDITGAEVKSLVNELQPGGSYNQTFDASGLSSGIYFCKLVSGVNSKLIKMLLLK